MSKLSDIIGNSPLKYGVEIVNFGALRKYNQYPNGILRTKLMRQIMQFNMYP